MLFVLEIFFGLVDLAFYYFISRTFAHVSAGNLGKAPSYFAFAIVGVLLGAVLNATSSTVGSRVRDEQLTGTLEMLAASPLNSFELCVGLVSFPFLFALARLGIYTIFALTVLGLNLPGANWPGFLLVLLAIGAAIAPIGILAGAATLVVKRGHVVTSTGVYLMTLLAGMAFPVAVLPGLDPLGQRSHPVALRVRRRESCVVRGKWLGYGCRRTERDRGSIVAFGSRCLRLGSDLRQAKGGARGVLVPQ